MESRSTDLAKKEEDQLSTSFLLMLPEEVLQLILSYLTFKDLGKTSRVSKQFYGLSAEDFLWKDKFNRHFPESFFTKQNCTNTTWQLNFKDIQIEQDQYFTSKESYTKQSQDLMKAAKKLLLAIKECDIPSLKTLFPESAGALKNANKMSELLKIKDNRGISLLEWVWRKNEKDLFDCIFKIVVNSPGRAVPDDLFSKNKKPSVSPADGVEEEWQAFFLQQSKFYWAIICHQVSEITICLDLPIRVLSLGCFHQGTPLINLVIAANSSLNVIERIVEKITASAEQVQARGLNGVATRKTPLIHAILNGRSDVATLLLEKGADVTVAGKHGKLPIHFAAEKGSLDIVKNIFEINPDQWDMADGFGKTPLLYACENGHSDVAMMLLEKGADVAKTTNIGELPIHFAAKSGLLNIVKKILEINSNQLDKTDSVEKAPYQLNKTDSAGKTPLMWAAKGGHVEMVAYLLKQEHILPFEKDSNNWTALHWAVQSDHPIIVDRFVAHYANENEKLPLSLIHFAAQHGSLEVIKKILENDLKQFNVTDKNKKTPLICAIQYNKDNKNKETIRFLSEAHGETYGEMAKVHAESCGLNTADKERLTALHWAIKTNNNNVAMMLINKGVDVTKAASNGALPMHLAASQGLTDVMEKILEIHPTCLTTRGEPEKMIVCALNSTKSSAKAVASFLFKKIGSAILEGKITEFEISKDSSQRLQYENKAKAELFEYICKATVALASKHQKSGGLSSLFKRPQYTLERLEAAKALVRCYILGSQEDIEQYRKDWGDRDLKGIHEQLSSDNVRSSSLSYPFLPSKKKSRR